MSTIAQQMQQAPEVQGAIQTLLKQLAEHQQQLDGIRPPDPELTQSYEQTLEDFATRRGGKLFFPYIASGIGHGPLVELADGSVKYDYTCGIGVHLMGHSHPRIVEACLKAAMQDVVMQGNIQQNDESYQLSKRLIDLAQRQGSRLNHCFLTSSGVMAGENALKMALQKKSPASRIIAFERCFAGRTITFSQINDKPAFRQGLPTTLHVDYVPFFDESDPEGSTQRSLDALSAHFKRYPGQHAAMIFELIQGEGGFYPGTNDYHRALMQLCRDNGVAVLVDEVQTFARTPQPFAFQHFGLDDMIDVVWLGKAAQVCATLFGDDFIPKPGLIAQTYTASSSAISASLATLDELEHRGYFGDDGKTVQLHNSFRQGLEAIASRHPDLLQGPWGLGAMTGCTPLQGNAEKVLALLHALYNKGVIAFVAGANPMRMRFLLPIGALEQKHIDETLSIFESTLVEVSSQ